MTHRKSLPAVPDLSKRDMSRSKQLFATRSDAKPKEKSNKIHPFSSTQSASPQNPSSRAQSPLSSFAEVREFNALIEKKKLKRSLRSGLQKNIPFKEFSRIVGSLAKSIGIQSSSILRVSSMLKWPAIRVKKSIFACFSENVRPHVDTTQPRLLPLSNSLLFIQDRMADLVKKLAVDCFDWDEQFDKLRDICQEEMNRYHDPQELVELLKNPKDDQQKILLESFKKQSIISDIEIRIEAAKGEFDKACQIGSAHQSVAGSLSPSSSSRSLGC